MTKIARATAVSLAAAPGYSLPAITLPAIELSGLRLAPRGGRVLRRLGLASMALALGLGLMAAAEAEAGQLPDSLRQFAEGDLATLAADPQLIEAIRAANAARQQLTAQQITALDAEWRAELTLAERPLLEPVLHNPAADILRSRIATHGGLMSEAFVMDARGLNVAMAAPTSDYWQGDEAKFSETFPKGPGAIHLGDVEFDDSTQSFQVQLSRTIVDPATSEPIGAITVALNADMM